MEFSKHFIFYFLHFLMSLLFLETPGIKRGVKAIPAQFNTLPATLEYGIGCGGKTMYPNQIVQIQSSNFETGANYFNNEGCTWTFTSTECALSIFCPCFDIPMSFGCFEDYLKINHQQFSFQGTRFCGKVYPVGVYRASSSNSLSVQFKSDYKQTGQGFLCYVRCTAPGKADPAAPIANCSLNSRNPYGFPDFT